MPPTVASPVLLAECCHFTRLRNAPKHELHWGKHATSDIAWGYQELTLSIVVHRMIGVLEFLPFAKKTLARPLPLHLPYGEHEHEAECQPDWCAMVVVHKVPQHCPEADVDFANFSLWRKINATSAPIPRDLDVAFRDKDLLGNSLGAHLGNVWQSHLFEWFTSRALRVSCAMVAHIAGPIGSCALAGRVLAQVQRRQASSARLAGMIGTATDVARLQTKHANRPLGGVRILQSIGRRPLLEIRAFSSRCPR
mmetsp:Transcript_22230/g.42707  ORF Transcript_22230/g.42707 Transcript_22230/m.42707 type:complete len:252 (-) Transcript_22230:45-800(-)